MTNLAGGIELRPLVLYPGRCKGTEGLLMSGTRYSRVASTFVLFVCTAIFVAIVPDRAIALFEAERILTPDGDGSGLAPLVGSFDVAVDTSGNAYVVGWGSHNVFRVSPENAVTQIIDATGAGLGAALLSPEAVAVGSAGDVYVVGEGSDNAFRIAIDGTISEIIDSTGDGSGNGLDLPRGIAVDSIGNAFVSGRNTNNLFKISPSGVITLAIDSGGAGAGRPLIAPEEVAVDANDNVYVVGVNSNNVLRRSPLGEISQVIGPSGDGLGNGLFEPGQLAVGPEGDVYVSGKDALTFEYRVFVIRPGGEVELLFIPEDEWIESLATDSLGRIFVGQFDAIRAYGPDGVGGAGVIVGSLGDGAGNRMLGPRGMAVGPDDAVYAVSWGNNSAFRAPSPVPEVMGVPVVALLLLAFMGRSSRKRA